MDYRESMKDLSSGGNDIMVLNSQGIKCMLDVSIQPRRRKTGYLESAKGYRMSSTQQNVA